MKHFNGMHRGDLEATEDIRINGTVAGDLIVLNGVAIISGVVTGDLYTRGGTAVVLGKIRGNLFGDPETIAIAVGALARGKALTAERTWSVPRGGTIVSSDTPTYTLAEVGAP